MITIQKIKQFLKCPVLKDEYFLKRKPFNLLKDYMRFKSLATQENENMIVNTHLVFENCEAFVPILKSVDQHWYLFVPVFHLKDLEKYQMEIEWIYYIATKRKMHIQRVYPIVVEKNFNKPLFKKIYSNYKKKLNLDDHLIVKYDQMIDAIQQDAKPILKKACLANKRCPRIKQCFALENDSLFFYRGLTIDEKLNAATHAKMHSNLPIEGRYCEAQLKALQTGYYFDQKAIEKFLMQIKKPIAYLDFEWTSVLNPILRVMEDQVFCFSVHIDNRSLQQFSFFSFNEINIVKQLIRILKNVETIVVFNAKGGEKMQLQKLKEKYPQHAKIFDAMILKIVDLEIPFRNGDYYDLRFEGKNGLKNLMQILPIRDRSHFDGEAMTVLFEMLDGKFDHEIVNEITRYNEMDTYTLYLLVQHLKKIIKQ